MRAHVGRRWGSALLSWLSDHSAALRLTVTLATFALVIGWAGPADVLRALAGVVWIWILAMIVPYTLGLWLQAWRWGLFLRLERAPTDTGRLFRRSWMARFFAYTLPGSLGGDMFRVIESRDLAQSRLAVARSVILDRLVGLVSLFGYVSLAGLLWSIRLELPTLQGLCWVGLGASVFGLVAFANPLTRHLAHRLVSRLPDSRFKRFAEDLSNSLTDLAGQHGLLVSAVLVTVLFNIIYASGAYFGFLALNVDIAPWMVLTLLPVVYLATVLPISVNGVGVMEGAFVVVFTTVGVSLAEATAVALLLQASNTAMNMFGGFLYLVERRRIKRRPPPIPAPQ